MCGIMPTETISEIESYSTACSYMSFFSALSPSQFPPSKSTSHSHLSSFSHRSQWTLQYNLLYSSCWGVVWSSPLGFYGWSFPGVEQPYREADRGSLWLQHRNQHFSSMETSFLVWAAASSSLESINLPDFSHRLLCLPKAHPVPEALLGTVATYRTLNAIFFFLFET